MADLRPRPEPPVSSAAKRRSVPDIRESGAAWVSEAELAWLCDVVQAALPLVHLPLPVSSDERVDWMTHRQRLKELLGGRDVD